MASAATLSRSTRKSGYTDARSLNWPRNYPQLRADGASIPSRSGVYLLLLLSSLRTLIRLCRSGGMLNSSAASQTLQRGFCISKNNISRPPSAFPAARTAR